jgi:hypothetical protein
VQVPLQLGTALASGVQHNWKSKATHAALDMMLELLIRVLEADICFHSNGTVSTLGSSIRQQLQQSGVLQQVATLMTALAADMHTETSRGWGPQSADAKQFLDYEASYQWFPTVAHLHKLLRELWEGREQGAGPADWLWGTNFFWGEYVTWTFSPNNNGIAHQGRAG